METKTNEHYKKTIKLLAAVTILALETGVYWYVWNGHFNRMLEFPFWRRGNWLMVALYGLLLLFFNQMYGGLKVGFLRRGNLIYSQILSVTFVNIITYLQIALLDKKFHNPMFILGMEAVDIIAQRNDQNQPRYLLCPTCRGRSRKRRTGGNGKKSHHTEIKRFFMSKVYIIIIMRQIDHILTMQGKIPPPSQFSRPIFLRHQRLGPTNHPVLHSGRRPPERRTEEFKTESSGQICLSLPASG